MTDSKIDSKITNISNDTKMIKNLLTGNLDKDIKLNLNSKDSDAKSESGERNITNIGVKLDNILKEFNVLKS